MQEAFRPNDLLEALWQRRALIAIVTFTATLLAIGVSLILPKQYTATATLIVEPPGGSDPRVATAVSPVYLESLKTYEQFASSDTLFARACEKFQLLPAAGSPAIESFKKRVLRVQKLKETKVLQIRVTLPDPKQAQRLVQFLAEETVALNASLARTGEAAQLQSAQASLASSKADLAAADKSSADVNASTSDVSLENEVESLTALNAQLGERIAAASAEVADFTARKAALLPQDTERKDRGYIEQELSSAQARLAALTKTQNDVSRELQSKTSALARWHARVKTTEADLHRAQTAYDTAVKRVAELNASSGLRSEQLRVVDPGIVPQKPSSPDVLLNAVAAALLGLLAALGYVTLQFALVMSRAQSARAGFRVARSAER